MSSLFSQALFKNTQQLEKLQLSRRIVDQNKYRDILPKGYVLHWYEVQSLLGRGGYGITYLALDKNLERNVAIKEYLPIDFASRQTDYTVHPLSGEHGEMYQWGLERFLKEARTLAKFSHPNIVRVLSVFEHNNTAYMVMEYEQGEDLSAVFKKKNSFSEEQLLDIFIPVLDGLSLVHREGFIHRDIKPSNIYIRNDQSPVLIDFGSARQSSGQTRTLTSLVTYGYAPFEQYNEGHERQGPWTDIYALGASLYYAITKTKPEDALKRGGAILAGAADPYEPVSQIAKGRYSENFLLAIDYALRFRAEDRPQDVLDWAEMLLDQAKAPALPEEFLKAKAAEQNLDSTVIMPAGFYDKNQQATGPSKRNTSRLIDSGGRRVTGEQKPGGQTQKEQFRPEQNQPPPYQQPQFQQPQFQQPQYQPPQNQQVGAEVSAPPRFEPRPTPTTPPITSATKSAKSHSVAVWALVGLIGVLLLAAVMLVIIPDNKPATVEVPAKAQVTDGVQPTVNDADQKAEKIAQLLKQAKQDFDAQHYVKPEGANAAYRYLQVLELDRNNKEAAAGLDRVTQHYADLVNQHLQNDEVLQAETNLRIIENVAPRSSVALGLRLKLQAAKDKTGMTAQLLKDAVEAFNANRLTQPDGDNALEKYRQVLQIDPLNQDAKRGVQKIFEYYADAADKQLTARNAAKASDIIEKMELVHPGSIEAEQMRKRLDKLTDRSTQISQLLRRAKSAYQAGRYTQPKGTDALGYYQQVLKIDPGNTRAKYGIEEIISYYKKQFDKAMYDGDFQKAHQMVDTLDDIIPNSSMVVAMYKKLEASKPPPKPEIEIISDIVSRFKNSMEVSDVQTVKNLSEFAPGREQFVDQFFANYRSFKINISGFQYIANDHKANAHASLSRLTNKKGYSVQPGAWGEFDIVVKKNKNNQWRIHW